MFPWARQYLQAGRALPTLLPPSPSPLLPPGKASSQGLGKHCPSLRVHLPGKQKMNDCMHCLSTAFSRHTTTGLAFCFLSPKVSVKASPDAHRRLLILGKLSWALGPRACGVALAVRDAAPQVGREARSAGILAQRAEQPVSVTYGPRGIREVSSLRFLSFTPHEAEDFNEKQ